MKMERCISLLKSSKSDNEKFAALLLIVKSIKSDEVDSTFRRKIFDNVGFSFINRLLLTTTVPEGCNENVYRSLALTLLACFSTDEELVNHPQLTQKIPVFVEALSDNQLSAGQVDDVLQCISAQAGSPRGRLLLLKCGALEALGTRYISGCSDCVEILIQLVSADWTGTDLPVFVEHFIHLMEELSVAFATNQDTLKFDLLSVLISIWTAARLENNGSCSYEACTNWLKPAATGLRDILQSRVDADKRISALHFASLLTQQFSLRWTFLTEINKSKSSFLLLLIQLVSVEVHLMLDGQSLEQVLPHSNVLSSCFTVMEHCVVLISSSTQKDKENDLTEEDLLQLHSSLREGLSYVVKFFREIEDKGPTISILMTQPLVLAAIRVLGAWLAEDSLSLSEDVHKILPFLVRLAGVHPEEGADWGDGDVMKFILPGFCQLIGEDVPRAILIQAKFHVVVQKYLDSLVTVISSQKSVEDGVLGQCLLCTSIFQTICICESDLVQRDVTFLCVLENICHLLRCRGNIGEEFTSANWQFGAKVALLLRKFSIFTLSRQPGCDLLFHFVRVNDVDNGLSLELSSNLAFLAILIIRRKGSLQEAGVLEQKTFVSTVLDIVVQCCECSQTKESQMRTLWSIVSEPSLLLLQELTVLLQTDEGFREAVSLNSSHISTFRTTLSLKSGQAMDDIGEKLEEFLAQLRS